MSSAENEKQVHTLHISRSRQLTHAGRWSKEKAMEKLRRQWIRATPAGSFEKANKFPPSWKPREHVWKAPWEIFSRLTQCRTKHEFIVEYYTRFVPNERKEKTEGTRVESPKGDIQQADTVQNKTWIHREILREADQDLDMETLGSKAGLTAMIKFLEKSGAFTKTVLPRERVRLNRRRMTKKMTERARKRRKGSVAWKRGK
ncbi:hypothetical protein J132_10320 [Termitomyces sp. J132]|nr:hypothetical protein J132_10320 [Termitomyces sp. J132]